MPCWCSLNALFPLKDFDWNSVSYKLTSADIKVSLLLLVIVTTWRYQPQPAYTALAWWFIAMKKWLSFKKWIHTYFFSCRCYIITVTVFCFIYIVDFLYICIPRWPLVYKDHLLWCQWRHLYRLTIPYIVVRVRFSISQPTLKLPTISYCAIIYAIKSTITILLQPTHIWAYLLRAIMTSFRLFTFHTCIERVYHSLL